MSITVGGHELRTYVARPEGKGSWPGVVVLHDVFGLTSDTRRQADWLASQGFLAIAPDLYSRGNVILANRATVREMLARTGTAFDEIDATRRALASHEDCTGRVGVIGFSMGAVFSLLCASRGGFAAASVNYGFVPKDIGGLCAGMCPVIGTFGGRDYTLRNAAARLEAALRTNGVTHEVEEYPGAEHSFMNRHDGVLSWVMWTVRMRPQETSAAVARTRIVSFFRRHL